LAKKPSAVKFKAVELSGEWLSESHQLQWNQLEFTVSCKAASGG